MNNSYYLVAPWAGNNITSSDMRIKDSSNSKYYIIKVDVINKDTTDADAVYEAVKVLAKNTTLVSDSVKYYLEKSHINKDVKNEDRRVMKMGSRFF